MWHRSTLLTSLTLLIGLWILVACTSSTPTVSMAPQLARVTARISVTCPNQPGRSGSGVVVGQEGYILTAYHVVQDAFTSDACTIRVGIGRRVKEPVTLDYFARPLVHDPAMDLALVRIVADRAGRPPGASFPFAQPRPTPLQVGETVHVLGFPSLSDDMLAYDTDTIISVGDCASADTCWLLTEAFASWGSSGGPVFDAEGWLVGITVGQRVSVAGVDEHRITTARPLTAVRAFLSRAPAPAVPLASQLTPTRPGHVQVDAWQAEVIGPMGANWRSEPSTEKGTETIIDVLPTGTILHVIPPGMWEGWWATADNQGRIGWIKEKATRVVLLRTFLTTVTPRLSTGAEAVVTCLTNAPCAHLRYSPGYAASGEDAIVGSLAGGTRVEVLEGPYFLNRLVWWRVRAGEIDGWLPEVTEEGYRLLAPLPAWK